MSDLEVRRKAGGVLLALAVFGVLFFILSRFMSAVAAAVLALVVVATVIALARRRKLPPSKINHLSTAERWKFPIVAQIEEWLDRRAREGGYYTDKQRERYMREWLA